jgi:hypothetical protein
MLRMFLITTTAGVLMAFGALAQADKPATEGASAAASDKFIAAQRPDQWVFSKFKGTNVIGPDNGNVGAVNDLLFDGTGKIAGVVVGVGGFLGIGAKNVAIDMNAFNVIPADTDRSSANSGSAANSKDASSIKLKVAWTKDQLMEAPDFEYYKPPAPPATTGAAPSGNRRPSTQ